MKWLRSLISVLAGFGFLMFAGFVAAGLSTMAGKAIVGALGAVMAGWMTARLAVFSPMGHAVVLALFVGAASLSSITGARITGWYPIVSVVISLLGVLAGGWIRAAADRARGTVEPRSGIQA